MLEEIALSNFGPLRSINWKSLGKINLIIGNNANGKTFLLKALYCSIRTVEEYKRGKEPRTDVEILADKLYWVYQPEKIGDLVMKGEKELACSTVFENREFEYRFGKDTTKQISFCRNRTDPRDTDSIFLPSKEVLSLHHIILQSRDQDRLFGFDDTYYDLARALRIPTQRGNFLTEIKQARVDLESILGRRIEYDETSARWTFKKGNEKYAIGLTAEGIKKK